jgi:hypothetical protein
MIDGSWDRHTFLPFRCTVHPFTRSEARACLANRAVAVVGNSVMRRFAIELMRSVADVKVSEDGGPRTVARASTGAYIESDWLARAEEMMFCRETPDWHPGVGCAVHHGNTTVTFYRLGADSSGFKQALMRSPVDIVLYGGGFFPVDTRRPGHRSVAESVRDFGVEMNEVLEGLRAEGFVGPVIRAVMPGNAPPGGVDFNSLLPMLSREDGMIALDFHTMLVKGRQLNYQDDIHPSRFSMRSAVALFLGEICHAI